MEDRERHGEKKKRTGGRQKHEEKDKRTGRQPFESCKGNRIFNVLSINVFKEIYVFINTENR